MVDAWLDCLLVVSMLPCTPLRRIVLRWTSFAAGHGLDRILEGVKKNETRVDTNPSGESD